ncbi:MAG: class I SAM-dependent methyltransferase, partial [Acidimicrobiia bacterium]|nr:class I SAM-dependent methyltransferase [Acidimicrobiia bacterium]
HFLHVDGLTIPLPDSSTDMVAMFSLLTHLRHEEAFLYLREARRVLRPGGTVVFSFLDFSQESHWSIFHETVAAVEAGVLHHVNQFMSRDLVSAWAKMLEYVVVNVYDGQGQYIECSDADGTRRLDSIGQSVAVWRKP